MKTVLVIAAHMDDEALGAGGTIARHVEAGDRVHVVFAAHRIYDHTYDEARNKTEEACALRARDVLGYAGTEFLRLPDERLDAAVQDIIVPLEARVQSLEPHVVYVNHYGDANQDHRAVFAAALVCLRVTAAPFVQRVLCYETPSSTEQAPPLPSWAFLPNCFVDISRFLDRKIDAIAQYETERRLFPHPRSVEALRLLAARRGIEGGFEAAEAFAILRDRHL
jgi:N-acetylglucosamine malate deacetylase 1